MLFNKLQIKENQATMEKDFSVYFLQATSMYKPELSLHLPGIHECNPDCLVLGHSLMFGQLIIIVVHNCLVTGIYDVCTGSDSIRWSEFGGSKFIQEVLVINITFPFLIIAESKINYNVYFSWNFLRETSY